MTNGRDLDTQHPGRLIQTIFRRVPSFRGKARLARLLLSQSARRLPTTVSDIDGNRFDLPNLVEPLAFSLWLDGCYEPELRAYLQRVCRPGGTFIDVGANIGVFTIPVARQLGPTGRVIAIEASHLIADMLRRNIALNRIENVTICECAASNSAAATVEFFDAPLSNFGMGSQAPQFDARPRTVPSISIDELVNRHGCRDVAAVKVDVEGFEAHVFQGARNTLDSFSPPIAFEFCDWAEERAFPGRKGWAQDILLELGYSIWRLSDYELGKPALDRPIREGSDTILALKTPRR